MLASATTLLTASWVWLVGAAVIGFWLLGAYNRLVRLRAAVVATFPSLDVQLRKRQGLVQGLIAALTESMSSAPVSAEGPGDVAVPAAAPTGAAAPVAAMVPLADPTAGAPAAAAEAVRGAAQALDRLGRRTIASGGWSNLPAVEVAERAVDVAVENLVSWLQTAALEAPLAPEVTELLDRVQRVRKPIAYSLEVYNDAAGHYNAALRVFPTSMAAQLFQFKPATLFALQRSLPAPESLSALEPG